MYQQLSGWVCDGCPMEHAVFAILGSRSPNLGGLGPILSTAISTPGISISILTLLIMMLTTTHGAPRRVFLASTSPKLRFRTVEG